ncbi:MAG: Trk family potassium uptake protein [Ruminococcaceae bacterium]|nr:Trk family potassium uptake protein [Oscillospiraceae bacterium]
MKKILRNLSHVQIIALGFLLLVTLGTLLLSTPLASASGKSVPVLDALFTSTSASCVTGLVTLDTGTVWSGFGQGVILFLLQIGGLGFMTIATMFFILFRKRMGLRQKEVMSESINASGVGGIRKLAKSIVLGTLITETIGAVILALRVYFSYNYSLGKAVWFGVFHSVSAFCNAGFDINGSFSSFSGFSGDPIICITLMVLIVWGGLGFLVWSEIRQKKFHFSRYNLHSKLVLTVSTVLIIVPALLFFVIEHNASHAGLSLGDQVLSSFFDSVSPRTAGMNITDTASLSNGGILLTEILMFIGGSPGSTAGGIKTTTVAVLLLFSLSIIRKDRSTNVFGRRLPDECIKKAVSVFFVNLTLTLLGVFLISCLQPNLSFRDLSFECFSAMGTVGMSTGITRDLENLSKIIIIFLMFCGRVGSISFGSALVEKKAPPPITNPYESVTIG